MNWMEVCLLVLGVGAFVGSFIIPEKNNADKGEPVDAEIIQKLIEKQMEDTKSRVSDLVSETLDYAVEKTERASERISNEKIMAISDYSETVLSDINKAHQEVMFLYDMLNDKHKNIKETVKQVDKQAKEAEEKVNKAAASLAAKQEVNAIFEQNLQSTSKNLESKKIEQYVDETELEQTINMEKNAKANRITLDMLGPEYAGVLPDQLKGEPNSSNGSGEILKKTAEGAKNVEVYSFIKEAPHVERNDTKQIQAQNLKNSVERIKEQQEKAADKKREHAPVKENNNDKILKLYKSGKDSIEIAKELGLGVGEVKLVINLFKGAV